MLLLRNRFLGGSAFGAFYAADGAAAGGGTPAPNSDTAGSTSPAVGADATSVSAAAAPDAGPQAASGATNSGADIGGAGDGGKEGTKPPAEPSSLISEAAAKPPGEQPAAPSEPAKADAKPEGEKPAEAPKKADEKPAEAAKPEDGKKPDAKAEDKPTEPVKAEPRSYEAFKLPEGAKLDEARVKSFTDIMENGELNHQQRAQALIDLHLAEIQNAGKARDTYQRDVWKAFQDKQKEELREDPIVGGNRMETALGRAKWVIEYMTSDASGQPTERTSRLLQALSYTGMGNNRDLAFLLDSVAEMLGEGDMIPAGDPKTKDNRPRKERWYGDGQKPAN